MFKNLFNKLFLGSPSSKELLRRQSIEELALKAVEQDKLLNEDPENWGITEKYYIESTRQLFIDEFGKDILDYLEKECTGTNPYRKVYDGKWTYEYKRPCLKALVGKAETVIDRGSIRSYDQTRIVKYKELTIERDEKRGEWIITVNPKCVGAGTRTILKDDNLDLRNELLKIIGNLIQSPIL